MNSDKFDTIVELWKEAQRVLGFRACFPHTITDSSSVFRCHAYLPDFGCKNGIVVYCDFDLDDFCDYGVMSLAAKKLGYSFSAMRISERFAMSEFKDALLDWGFFGDPEDRPDWLAQQAGDSGLRATD